MKHRAVAFLSAIPVAALCIGVCFGLASLWNRAVQVNVEGQPLSSPIIRCPHCRSDNTVRLPQPHDSGFTRECRSCMSRFTP